MKTHTAFDGGEKGIQRPGRVQLPYSLSQDLLLPISTYLRRPCLVRPYFEELPHKTEKPSVREVAKLIL